MDINSKDKLLIAMHMEYQKDIPLMEKLTYDTVGLEPEVFDSAVKKLQEQDLIKGARIKEYNGKIYGAFLSDAYLTSNGITYVKEALLKD